MFFCLTSSCPHAHRTQPAVAVCICTGSVDPDEPRRISPAKEEGCFRVAGRLLPSGVTAVLRVRFRRQCVATPRLPVPFQQNASHSLLVLFSHN